MYPQFLLHRLGTDTRIDRSGVYPFRMFGIRTVLIGADLLTLHGDQRRRASRLALLIHASDTASAATAWLGGYLPRRAGITTTLISAVNTGLALVALKEP